ncbi:MAG TPA: hypothetical protein GXX15_06530 [Clostridia bacterium]|nr:hypothetical protein [Clostridia bacterium]
MKKIKVISIILIIGLVWGIIFLCFTVIINEKFTPITLADSMMTDKPFSAIYDVFTVDSLVGIFRLLFLPYAVGYDLFIWTIGLIVWTIKGGLWPGEALGRMLIEFPDFGWFMLIAAPLLGGVVSATLFYLIIRGTGYLLEKLLKATE